MSQRIDGAIPGNSLQSPALGPPVLGPVAAPTVANPEPNPGPPEAAVDLPLAKFSEVLREEHKLIAARRQVVRGRDPLGPGGALVDQGLELRPGDLQLAASEDALLKQARLASLRGHVTGMSFCGGGIRSGTFAVGFLQGMAALGLLRRVDYLSTVSGGGYAGAWLAAWLKREGGDPANVEHQLSPSRVDQARAARPPLGPEEVVDEEPQPVRHLRSYSSFMFPRPGILSVDTWTVIMIWARNVTINHLMVLPVAMLLVVLARVAALLFVWLDPVDYDRDFFMSPDWIWAASGLGLGLVLMVTALVENSLQLGELRRLREHPTEAPRSSSIEDRKEIVKLVRYRIILPGALGALLLTVCLRPVVWGIGDLVDRLRIGTDSSADPGFLSMILGAFQANLSILGASNFLMTAGILALVLGLGAAWNASWRLTGRPRRESLAALVATWSGLALLLASVLGAFGLLGAAARSALEPLGNWPAGLALVVVVAAAALALVVLGRRGRRFVVAAAAGGATGGALLVLLEAAVRHLAMIGRPDLMATFGPPLTILIVVVAMIIEVAFMGRSADEAEREWLARINARLTLVALFWIVGMSTVLYVPGLFLASGTIARSLIASGWLASAAAGVLSGRLRSARGAGDPAIRLTQLGSVAAQVFLIGMLGAVALVASLIVNVPGVLEPRGDDLGAFAGHLDGVKGASPVALILLFVGTLGLYVLGRDLIDINLFSLNAMYTNRLTRCYLGASRPMSSWARRWADSRDPRAAAGAPSLSGPDGGTAAIRADNPITNFDPSDDLDLRDLRIGKDRWRGRDYYGPHLLINTTLNMVGDDDLATRDRKGESFTLSPLYCGSKGVGYARYEGQAHQGEERLDPNLTLGRAIAISGAAVDPNMSFYQSAPLTALLTLFNARLGYWIERPTRGVWRADSPRISTLLLRELFGRTDGRGDFLHLSDGGHFENLGAYELIRRRCRYVIVVDAAEDPDASDDNLSTLIRLCRIDFGIRIKLDTAPLRAEGPDRLCRSHVVIGQIHYEDVDRGELPGVLVYVKSSMTGDETPDIQKYARRDSRFPHQPTDLRQAFNEEQFECYRCLGDHVARKAFEEPVGRLNAELLRNLPGDGLEGQGDDVRLGRLDHRQYVPLLFSAIQERWSEPPEGQAEDLDGVSEAWATIMRDLATRPELSDLGRDLYPMLPEIAPTSPVDRAVREHAELHTIGRMLQVMELTWGQLRLKRNSGLSINRGWMNTFRRCAGTAKLRRVWPVLRSEFSSEFVRFCELQLNLSAATPEAVRLEVDPTGGPTTADDFGKHAQAIELIAREFEREWPADIPAGRGVLELIARSAGLGLDRPPVWVIYQAPSGTERAGDSPDRFPCGIILAAPFANHPDPGLDRGDPEMPIELFVWVRRPHRSVGLGSRCLTRGLIRGIREEIRAKRGLGKPATLWARYPLPKPADDDIEHANWVIFLARYDFRPRFWKAKDGAKPWNCSLLELD